MEGWLRMNLENNVFLMRTTCPACEGTCGYWIYDDEGDALQPCDLCDALGKVEPRVAVAYRRDMEQLETAWKQEEMKQ